MPVLHAFVCSLLVLVAAVRGQDTLRSAVGDELQRLTTKLATLTSDDASVVQVRRGAEPELALVRQALSAGRPSAALYRLARVRGNVLAIAYQAELQQRGPVDLDLLDREWARVGEELAPWLAEPLVAVGDGLGSALLRALVEAAAPRVRGHLTASRDYGHATIPGAGLFYLGAAAADRDFVVWARNLPQPTNARLAAPRSLHTDLDALHRDMLVAYVPPLSLEHHQEFVAAHSALQDARTLETTGLRHGALLRFVQAAMRFSALRPETRAWPRARIEQSLADARARLADGDAAGLGGLWLELAEADLDGKGAGEATPVAQMVAAGALPAYFAAMAPAPTARPAPAVAATVTLVRWPYT